MKNNSSKKKNEEIYDLTPHSQKLIAAWLLADKKALEENIGLIKPEYFDYEFLRAIMTLMIDFFNKYSRTPTEDELLQEVDTLLEKNKRLPVDLYLDVCKEVIALSRDSSFDYIKDKVVDFGRYQAFHRAIIEASRKLKNRDYDGIVNLLNTVASIGSEDGILRTLSDIEARDVSWLWKNHIPLGEITLLVGDPGVGKSYFSYFLSAQISKGGSWPDAPDELIECGKILILSTDEDPNYAIRPRSDAAGADADKITVLEGSRGEKGEIKILNLTKDIRKMEEIFKKDKSYRLWIIDTLTDYLGRLDSNKYSDVRWGLMPILALARKYNIAIIGILHCNKNTSLQVLYRIMGSMGFAAVARSIWVIAKDRDDEKERRRFFAPLKNNLAPEQKPLAFHLENLGKVAKIIFEDKPVEDSFDIEEVLVPAERSSETKRAKKFLLEILKDDAVSAKEIKSTARDEGLSWGTVRRAKDKMGCIRAFKEKVAGGGWFWELNEINRALAAIAVGAEVEEIRRKHTEDDKTVTEQKKLTPEEVVKRIDK